MNVQYAPYDNPDNDLIRVYGYEANPCPKLLKDLTAEYGERLGRDKFRGLLNGGVPNNPLEGYEGLTTAELRRMNPRLSNVRISL